MNTFHALARRVDDVTAPTLNVDELIEQGEHRLHRRRMAAVLASVAFVAVVAVVAFGGFVAAGVHHQSNGPVNQPNERKTNDTDHNNPSVPVTREIVYFDSAEGTTVHYGDRVVDIGDDWFFMDVTDDGFVYQRDGTPGENTDLMFTDGGRPERIASDICVINPGFPGTQVRAANEGSLVTWFDCSGPPPAELVVFDTSLGREVARQPVTQCGMEASLFGCNPDAIIGDHVYFRGPYFLPSTSDMLEFDIATGRLSKVKTVTQSGYERALPYLDDIRSHPRGLVIGDSWATGKPTPKGEGFSVVGSRLVPASRLPDGSVGPLTSAFDTATGRAVRLRIPQGYQGAGSFGLFEWLDDDTVALVGPTGWDEAPGYGDILTCRLSDGQCDLVARGLGPVRVAANDSLPG